MKDPAKILIVDDEKIALKNMEHVLKKEGYDVVAAGNGQTALKMLQEKRFEVVLTDLKMEKVDGMHILQYCREHYPDVAVILITGYATLESAIIAMKNGAFHYIAKPFKLEEMQRVIREALADVEEKRSSAGYNRQVQEYKGKVKLLTNHPALVKTLELARNAAGAPGSVFITGEVGTGKEVLARYIHAANPQSGVPFFSVNCDASDEDTLRRELFGPQGYDRLRSASSTVLEMARGGVLYLAEIPRLPLNLQLMLLQYLENSRGSLEDSRRDNAQSARIIASSSVDPEVSIREGRLRSDLYYRLKIVTLSLPPLRERRDDIPLLSYYFLKKQAGAMGKDVTEISREVMAMLMNYQFPGNVAELESIIERGVVLSHSGRIEKHHLHDQLRELDMSLNRKQDGAIPSLEEQEIAYIMWVLKEVGGNKSAAAQILGIDRVSLWRKLKKHGMEDQE